MKWRNSNRLSVMQKGNIRMELRIISFSLERENSKLEVEKSERNEFSIVEEMSFFLLYCMSMLFSISLLARIHTLNRILGIHKCVQSTGLCSFVQLNIWFTVIEICLCSSGTNRKGISLQLIIEIKFTFQH